MVDRATTTSTSVAERKQSYGIETRQEAREEGWLRGMETVGTGNVSISN